MENILEKKVGLNMAEKFYQKDIVEEGVEDKKK